MPRLAASLSESQYAWVESESESRDVSMAQVIRDLIDGQRTGESLYDSGVDRDSDRESGTKSFGEQIESLADRVDELEARLGSLEAAEDPEPTTWTPKEVEPESEPMRTPEPEESEDIDDDLAEAVREYLDVTDQPPKKAHGRDAVADVFRQLRENGTMGTGEIQSAVYPGYEDYWAGPRAMWNAIDRYLEDIPGIEKGGYGEWEYSGDSAVRNEIGDAVKDALENNRGDRGD